ncbi:ribose-phosphate pyrophosphokinase [Miniphocaeibacter massiliensis]|uniref:ribose-phosphate pyrophosphokinase n=1 Tax=Miniphocaeibacter massiliensis TaxID=2041841 RepID=UPI000C1BC4A8|nr:ribose-phosphate pyrophosphokinase [Miniphocaeibacter massiliensis]
MPDVSLTSGPLGELGLIVLRSITDLGNKLDKDLKRISNIDDSDFSFIIDISETRFSNGEGKVQIDQSVRGKDIFILCDIGNYGVTYKMFGSENRMTPDEHFADVKRVISAINGKAKRINVVMPLMYGSRQHRRKSRESLDCAMALHELQNMGVHGVYTFDVHDPNVQNAIPLLSFENIYPTAEIVKSFLSKEKISDEELDSKNIIIISPDTGAMDRAVYYSNVLQQDIGLFYKRRDYSRIVNGKNPIVEHRYIGKDVDGKDILIVDDMIASGESVLDIAEQLKAQNARRIYCAVSFALFTEGPKKFDEYFKKGLLDAVYSTNLTYVPDEIRNKPWFKEVNLAPLLSKFIYNINCDASLSGMLDKMRGIKRIVRKKK